MRRWRRKIALLITTLILAIGCNTNVYAGAESFYYSIGNNGKNFTYNEAGGVNKKTYAGQNWSYKVKKISFTTSKIGLGMCYRLVNQSTGNVSKVSWASQAGVRTDNTWNDGGPKGTYLMQGRTDDTLVGKCTSNGYWNADIIVNWPS